MKTTQTNWRPYLTQYEREMFRELSPEEIATAKAAVSWLIKKRIRAEEIHNLSFRNVDEEEQRIRIVREGKRFVIVRSISYSGTPLEDQIWNARELQKSSHAIFSKAGRKGYARAFTPTFRTSEINEMISGEAKNKEQKVWTKRDRKRIITIKW